jgi:hypothetical protein
LTQEQKNRFDALMRLSDFRFQRWQDRRKYEWQVSLGLWTLMAAAIYYQITLSSAPLPYWLAVLIVVVVVPTHAYWVLFNLDSNLKDINCAFYYWDHARVLISGQEQPPPNEDQRSKEPFGEEYGGLTARQRVWYRFLREPPCVTQILTTVTLALLLTWLVFTRGASP